MALRGKVAIITGASSGLGAGIAKYFAQEGAVVSITGRRKEKLQRVAQKCEELHASNNVLTTIGDITEDSTRQNLVQRTKQAFGKIDILVNNAGVVFFQPLMEQSREKYDEMMNVNLRCPVFLTKQVVPHLVETKGCVVNISSISSVMPGMHRAVYGMSKAGLDIFTRALARELGPEGVRVNSINPGYVPTDVVSRSNLDPEAAKQFDQRFRDAVPLGRNGTPEDIAQMAVFLASDKASFVTGQIILVDGGVLLQPPVRLH